ncbi:MAG: restriction endonuclease subunit S [Verrucomicrobiae bacterium]|nr:restriction endonuclease subunit S [Verrucomicrobiae bacterium]
MATFPTSPITDLFRLKQGTYLKPDEMAEAPSEEFPFRVYGANGVIGYSNRKMYSDRTTLISCRGANCGVVHFTTPDVWISNNSIACVPKAEIDPTFYHYVCLNTDFGDVITGSAQPQITITNLSSKELIQPPLPVQRRIAGILSAYDELMENSQRRIRLLEAMARALYREWFVHFRFPGNEKHPRVASPLGDIHQGWEVKKLGEVLELNYGKALKQEDRSGGDVPVFGPSGIVGQHDTALVKGPGIIVGRKGNVGSVFWCAEDFFVIDTAYFVTSSLPLRFLFYVLPTLNFLNSDAAVPGLSRNQAYTLEILVPPAALLKKFCALADTFERQASTLQRQIQNLRRTRDLLLPRLLSGQVEIKVQIPV